jgi:hypothetical protein
LVGSVLIFVRFQKLFDIIPYFFDDPLVMQHRAVWSSGVLVFFAVSFVVEFWVYSVVVRQYGGGYFSFLMFVRTCFAS